jgi:ATP-dependent protease Clp ATPase subunit
VRILVEPENNLIKQQIMLMGTEDVTLNVDETAVREMARVAFECNQTVENIGARRSDSTFSQLSKLFSSSFDLPFIVSLLISTSLPASPPCSRRLLTYPCLLPTTTADCTP